MSKVARPLPPPTAEEREKARTAAAALRAAFADPATMGARSVMHVDYSRRDSEWLESWRNVPGFVRINRNRYRHDLLPGWEYTGGEIKAEMIPDLEALAEHGRRPTEATR